MHRLGHAFFQRDAKKLAQDLIGAVLVRRVRGREYRARILKPRPGKRAFT